MSTLRSEQLSVEVRVEHFIQQEILRMAQNNRDSSTNYCQQAVIEVMQGW